MKALVIGVAVAILLAAGVAVAAVGGAFEGEENPAARPAALKTDRFDGRRAFAELRRQVELGPRPAGSKRLRQLAVRLRDGLPRGRFEAVPGHPGLRNIVGHLPGTRPAVVVAAHYDTKQLPGFVGANDGAGGTAAVMELARVLRRTNRPEGAPELRFVLFDGEEATDDRRDFRATGLRGSTAYARRHADELRALVLLDFVADKRPADPARGGLRPGAVVTPADGRSARRRRLHLPRRHAGRDHRRPHAVRRGRSARDRPHRLRLPLLAPDLRRPERGVGDVARPLRRIRARAAAGLEVSPSLRLIAAGRAGA